MPPPDQGCPPTGFLTQAAGGASAYSVGKQLAVDSSGNVW